MQAFEVLADRTRRRIVELLGAREHSVNELVREFEVSASAISQHLKALRGAGLVKVRVDAQRRIYMLEPAALAEIDSWLASVRRFWPARLDALQKQLAKPRRKKR
jgi:DNA-binding transcriptional ArsR family regulator